MRFLYIPPPKALLTLICVFLMAAMVMVGSQSIIICVFLSMIVVMQPLGRRMLGSLLLASGAGALTSILLWEFAGSQDWSGQPYRIMLSLQVVSLFSYLMVIIVVLRRGRIPRARKLQQEYEADGTLTELEKRALVGGLFTDRPNRPICMAENLHSGQSIMLMPEDSALIQQVDREDDLIHIKSDKGPLVLLRRSRLALDGPISIQRVSLAILLAAGLLNVLVIALTGGK